MHTRYENSLIEIILYNNIDPKYIMRQIRHANMSLI